MEIENIAVEKLIPYEFNNKVHDETQVNRIANSIKEFGFLQPIVIDKDNVIIVGHGRLEGAKKLGLKEVPCVRAENLTEAQIKKYRILDNKLNESERDIDNLKLELDDLGDLDIGDIKLDISDVFPDLGLDDEEETEIEEDEAPEIEEDEAPEVSQEAKVVRGGDLFMLGNHRLLCGDATNIQDFEALLDGNIADLVFTDPPYGMKKEKEGVLNDNLNYEDLLEFNKERIPLSFAYLKDNGSWYCWGIDEPLMDIYSEILKPMQKENKITFRNLITWKKENDNPTMLFNGACSSNNRSRYTNEKCLFVMCGVQGFNNNADHYDETFEPIRSYMEAEAKKVGLNSKKLTEITGVQMFGHRFTKSQFGIIPQEHYEKLQKYYEGKAFELEYNELKSLFKTLKEAIMSKRAYFDGTSSQCIDVRVHDVTSQKEREFTGGHATPKPLGICERGIKASSRENEIVLDCFGGSGSTLIACEQLNRKCYMMELDSKYIEVIIKRYHNLNPNAEIKCLNRDIDIKDILQ